MTVQCCSKCGESLHNGRLKYIVRIKVLADFDGHISSEDQAEGDNLDALIGQIEGLAAKALENDIHQEMAFLLCKDCREIFVRNPLSCAAMNGIKKGEFSGRLH